MKSIHPPLIVLVVAMLAATSALRAEEEREVTLEEIPQVVLNAAMVAVPGLAITEAEVESRETGEVYEIEGEADGREVEIQITADGTVLGVEADDDENEGEADDDDHDDDHDHDHQHDHDTSGSEHKKHDG